MKSTKDEVLVARMLVVAYLLGTKNTNDIPNTVDEMMSRGHDGLNWQLFVPVAKDLLGKVGMTGSVIDEKKDD